MISKTEIEKLLLEISRSLRHSPVDELTLASLIGYPLVAWMKNPKWRKGDLKALSITLQKSFPQMASFSEKGLLKMRATVLAIQRSDRARHFSSAKHQRWKS